MMLSVRNRHTPRCGVPPLIDADDRRYVGYFANRPGEQWLFLGDDQRAVIRGGDVGWENEYEVSNGVDGCVDDLVLDPAETAWVKACWLAWHAG